MLNLEAIKAKSAQLKRKNFTVPEWGGDIIIREMSGIERLDFAEWISESKPSLSAVIVRVVSCCCVNDSGAKLFTESDLRSLIDTTSFPSLMDIYGVARDLSGMVVKEGEG